MTRKLFAAALFAVACAATLYASSASAVDEAPPPRAVGEPEKKPDENGKFAGKGKFDPEKLKALKDKFGGKIDPEKLKELKEKIKNGEIDPEKLKKLKEKFGKGGNE